MQMNWVENLLSFSFGSHFIEIFAGEMKVMSQFYYVGDDSDQLTKTSTIKRGSMMLSLITQGLAQFLQRILNVTASSLIISRSVSVSVWIIVCLSSAGVMRCRIVLSSLILRSVSWNSCWQSCTSAISRSFKEYIFLSFSMIDQATCEFICQVKSDTILSFGFFILGDP